MHKKKAKKRNEGLEEERKIAKQKAFNALRLPSRSPLLDGAKWVEREEAKKSLERHFAWESRYLICGGWPAGQ